MYVNQQSWLENGPRRRRRGLGETVSLTQVQKTFDGMAPLQGQLVPDRLDQSTVSDSAYSFLDSATGVCVFGSDPSNPNCLSDLALAQSQRGGGGSSPAGGGAGLGLNMNYIVYGSVGLLVLVMVAKR